MEYLPSLKHFNFSQIVNINSDDNQALSSLSGDIVFRNAFGNVTTRTVSYVISENALKMAQNTSLNSNGQLSVLYFADNLFPSDLNVSEVSSCNVKSTLNKYR